ncbi:hypothetical protein C1645_831352 [Glomus cerebriforme]|uniref:Secreted protein n=1 Tax=Glomus cerebriforme TaxID=658196 RepID=A0A397SFN4_9GLOM|nr:hypothetical protein C1645_831352 [Glomus cerebriforme]
MSVRLLGASSFLAVIATSTSRVVHPRQEQNRNNYHSKKEEQQNSSHHYNHPHYQFQYQLKPKYPAFSRYGQTVDIEPTTKRSKKSKLNKRR